jgi:ABC-type phosphate transport system substrate-binding protein
MRSFIAATIIAAVVAVAAHADVAIIAHPSVPVDTITQDEALDVYTGEIRRWKNGELIVVIDLTEQGIVRDEFYKFLGLKSSRVKSIWVKNFLTGEGTPPLTAQTDAQVLAKVVETPGAIGYIRSDLANDKVKVLAVIPNRAASP